MQTLATGVQRTKLEGFHSLRYTVANVGFSVLWAIAICAATLSGSQAVAEPTLEELEAASLLASRATFGMTYEQIVEMAEQGLDDWLDEQLDMECTRVGRWEERLVQMDKDGEFEEFRRIFDFRPRDEDPYRVLVEFRVFDTSWYMTVRYATDQLCQRVAWALSQIFVVNLRSLPDWFYSRTSYYDILLENAFGTYRELIEDVTYSTQMGLMLSHLNNSRARPEKRLFPDENYSRELMQLFSIGLFELNIDGSTKTDESGELIPTYDADDIANLARVMTGHGLDGEHAHFGADWTDEWDLPMHMFDWHHDKDEKVILEDTIIPAEQLGKSDISDALDAIAEHANVGPFIGRQLIQRLVTSNPEREYVQRVAEAFNDDGQGVRGNLKHVVKTILTDPAATNPSNPNHFGKLREPVIRVMNLHRMFPTEVVGEDTRGLSEPIYMPGGAEMFEPGDQRPLDAPSVFNFFSPFHSPKGDLSDRDLVAPEFQIFNMRTAFELSNMIWDRLLDHSRPEEEDRYLHWFNPFWYEDENGDEAHWHPVMSHDISNYVEIADSPADLVDRLDLVMTYGSLNSNARSRVIQRVEQITSNSEDSEDESLRKRVWFAIWYMSMLPDYMVETY